MPDTETPFDLCVCGHMRASHTKSGECVVCESKVQHCPSFWSQQAYNDAVQSAQAALLQAEQERQKSSDR